MKENVLSRYHPIVSFIFFIGAICCAVLFLHPLYVAAGVLASSVFYVMLNGRKGIGFMFKLIPLFAFVMLINPIVNTRGKTVIFRILGRPYTLEALEYGAIISAVFIMMILWWGCYSVVFSGEKLISIFGNILPTIALLLVMVFRLIPEIRRKMRNIQNERTAIGKGVDASDGLKNSLLFGVSNLGIIVSMALENSIITGDSMRARGYGTGKRISFQVYRFTYRDGILVLIMMLEILTIAICSLMERNNILRFILYLVFILLPIILHIKERIKWKFLERTI